MDFEQDIDIGNESIADLMHSLYSDEEMWEMLDAEEDNSESLTHYGVGWDENPPGRGSGRYAHGSGDHAFQRDYSQYARYTKYKKQGMSDAEIAQIMGYKSSTDLRAQKTIWADEVRSEMISTVTPYLTQTDPKTGKLYSNMEIARITGYSEAYVRNLRKDKDRKTNRVDEVVDQLRKQIDEGKLLDVGSGVSENMNVPESRLNAALNKLRDEGYTIDTIYVPQISNPELKTPMKILAAPNTPYGELFKRRSEVVAPNQEGDFDLSALEKRKADGPVAIDLKRVDIKYDEDGGTERDGMIQIKAYRDENGQLHAVSPDLDLGNSKYAQVRILVDGGDEYGLRYIKGMAVYNTDISKDIMVNSNKSVEKGVDAALKKASNDEGNPFGTNTVATYLKDKEGNYILNENHDKVRSAINVVGTLPKDAHVEGSFADWSRNLPAQFLAKQPLPLIKRQLDLKLKQQKSEYDVINSIENTEVRKSMLKDFAESADQAAVDLKAASLPGQMTHVLLSVPSLKPNTVFAPNYDTGTDVVLIRFPHAGPFEIVKAKVDNSNKEANSFLKGAKDAVGIRPDQASKLSGADQDGDTAIVIPLTRKNSSTGTFESITNVKERSSLKELEGFDPTGSYGQDAFPGVKWKRMSKKTKGLEMGKISNLITDMYAKGCDDEKELADAVRYSMVVIDAEKHNLNYQQAKKDYNIEALQKKYQMRADGKYGAAASLLSRSKSPVKVPLRAQEPWNPKNIDPETGEYNYKVAKDEKRFVNDRERVRVKAPDGYTYTDPVTGKTSRSKYLRDDNGNYVYEKNEWGSYKYVDNGKIKEKTTEIPKMASVKDARALMSDNPSDVERLYADYANNCKALANEARKAYLATPKYERDPEQARVYASEVASLKAKLAVANANSPRERKAQAVASQLYRARYNMLSDDDKMDKEKVKKTRVGALRDARDLTGASKERVKFTDKEWEAVEKHAISGTMLRKLLSNAESQSVYEHALPKKTKLTPAMINNIVAMYNNGNGFTQEQIASSLGIPISTSTISDVINGKIG